jgi:hypothetical protein
VERGSTKHGPRLDEEMQRETEAMTRGAPVEPRTREEREHEPVELEVSLAPGAGRSAADESVMARRELSRHLDLHVFPATRDALLANAEAHDAPESVLAQLASLPADTRFGTVHQVWAALTGETDEAPHGRVPRDHTES